MTYEEKIQKARQYMVCLRRENLLKARVQSMKDRAISLNGILSPICGQSDKLQSTTEKAVERLEQAQKLLVQAAGETEQRGLELDMAMAGLKPDEFAVIQKRYIEGKTFTGIADEIHLTLRRVYQIHRNAVNNMQFP